MIRDAFHRQGPFVGSGGHYSPGPATVSAPCGESSRPLNGALAPPWVFVRSSPFRAGRRPNRDVPFARPARRRFDPPPPRFELGPRSLDPAALFGARLPSLFEARRRLTTSATASTTCGQPNPGCRSSLGRRPRSPSGSDTPRRFLAKAVACGEPRRAHPRRPR